MRDFTLVLFLFVLAVGAVGIGRAPAPFETDTIKTSSGDLQITFIGHASLGFRYGKLVVYVDPVSQYADFAMLVKADIVLVTHEHGDHLDPKAIQALRTDKTVLVGTAKCASQVPGMVTMANGDSRTVQGLQHRQQAADRRALPRARRGQRLRDYVRRQAGVCGGRHGEHP